MTALDLVTPTAVRRGSSAQEWQPVVIRRIITGDAAAAVIAICAALLIRFPGGASRFYLVVSVGFPAAWLAALWFTRSYEERFLGAGSEEYRRVFDAGLRLLAFTALALFAFRLNLARTYALIGFPLATVLTLANRAHWRHQLHLAREKGLALHRLVVVGRTDSAAELVRQLQKSPAAGFEVVGVCVDGGATEVEGVPVVSDTDEVVSALHRLEADTVAVAAYSGVDLRRLAWQLERSGIDLVVAPSLTDVAGPRIHIRPVAGLPLLHVEEPEFTGGRRALKTAFDRTVAGAALLILAPWMLLIALAVKLESRGPAIFRQTRVGTDGSTFTILKFRSMCQDAETQIIDLRDLNERSEGLLFKVRQDPRVTRVGRFLRRYSLDELPQLINIARGDMSLVGPRPPLPTEVSQYGDDVRRRLLVKPGLTGLWQVSGRSDLTWDESISLDLHYVENWSLALDLSIIARTVRAVLGRRGAY